MSALPDASRELSDDLSIAAARETAARLPSLRGTRVVILAGGRGTRLAPYTSILPKPLMPVGDRSILEIVVDQLAGHGVERFTFSVGYLSHLIRAVFENRANGHVTIDFVHEEVPLGTAAPLRLVDGLDHTFIVMNGDVLTTLDFPGLVQHHRSQGSALTIATHQRDVTIDYGILEIEHGRVIGFREKPSIPTAVSMGIYVMEPDVLDFVPTDGAFDFPDLVQALLAAGRPVDSYRHDGVWFDIGRRDDYEQAALVWEHQNGNGASGNGNGSGHVEDLISPPEEPQRGP